MRNCHDCSAWGERHNRPNFAIKLKAIASGLRKLVQFTDASDMDYVNVLRNETHDQCKMRILQKGNTSYSATAALLDLADCLDKYAVAGDRIGVLVPAAFKQELQRNGITIVSESPETLLIRRNCGVDGECILSASADVDRSSSSHSSFHFLFHYPYITLNPKP